MLGDAHEHLSGNLSLNFKRLCVREKRSDFHDVWNKHRDQEYQQYECNGNPTSWAEGRVLNPHENVKVQPIKKDLWMVWKRGEGQNDAL